MYCRFCGKELMDGARFCGICGKEQSAVTTMQRSNPKAVFCYLISIFVEIVVMIASFLNLINIEFHLTVGMWGVYSVEKSTMNLGAIDILKMVGETNKLSYMSDSFNNYFVTLGVVSSLILFEVLVCAIYMIIYIACYSYNGNGKNADIFGVHFVRYSSIPSVISAILVIALIMLGSRGTNEYSEYVTTTPAIGSVLIVLGAISHIFINAFSRDLRNHYTPVSSVPNYAQQPIPATNKDALGKLKSISTERVVDRPWNCGDCGTLNSENTIKCVNCGKYKD